MSSQVSDLTEYDYSGTDECPPTRRPSPVVEMQSPDYQDDQSTLAPSSPRAEDGTAMFPEISPPSLGVRATGGTDSKNTRTPRYYDMHLHHDLILKKVVCFPDMLSKLAGVVDDAIRARSIMEFPDTLFPNFRTLDGWADGSGVIDEDSIVEFYKTTTSRWSCIPASALALEDPRWRGLLELSHSGGTSRGKGAVADAFLRIDEKLVREAKRRSSEEMRANIELLMDDTLSNRNFVVFEFKNWLAGSLCVMTEIARLASVDRKFPWVQCNSTDECTNRAQHFEKSGQRKVTGNRMGFDAKGQLCNVPTVSAARERQSSPVPSSRESSFYSQTTTTTECSLNDPSILDEADTKARHIVQQVWAQAVKNDATFVVIHSGNYEFIGIRHRGTQTLYLSEMICVPECTPTYYKVHTGLYTASLLDAIDRAKQMKAAKNGDIPVPLSWQTYYQHNSVTVKGGNSPRPRRPAKPAKKDVTKEKAEHVSSVFEERDAIEIRSPKYPVLEDNEGTRFVRSDLTKPPADDPAHPTLLLNISGIYTARSFWGALEATGVSGFRIDGRVAIKLASTPEQEAKLRVEEEFYRYLSKKVDGVPQSLGMFESGTGTERVLALITPMAGVSLSNRKICRNTVTNHTRKLFVDILQEIHRAGILHGDISPAHLVVDDARNATIVGFGNAERMEARETDIHGGDRKKSRELNMLHSILQVEDRKGKGKTK